MRQTTRSRRPMSPFSSPRSSTTARGARRLLRARGRGAQAALFQSAHRGHRLAVRQADGDRARRRHDGARISALPLLLHPPGLQVRHPRDAAELARPPHHQVAVGLLGLSGTDLEAEARHRAGTRRDVRRRFGVLRARARTDRPRAGAGHRHLAQEPQAQAQEGRPHHLSGGRQRKCGNARRGRAPLQGQERARDRRQRPREGTRAEGDPPLFALRAAGRLLRGGRHAERPDGLPSRAQRRPLAAARQFLAENRDFEVDRRLPEKYFMSLSPEGFLRRKGGRA